jgi:hypothetical protein
LSVTSTENKPLPSQKSLPANRPSLQISMSNPLGHVPYTLIGEVAVTAPSAGLVMVEPLLGGGPNTVRLRVVVAARLLQLIEAANTVVMMMSSANDGYDVWWCGSIWPLW